MDFKQIFNKQENTTLMRTTISGKEADQFTQAQKDELRREENVEFKSVNDWGHDISRTLTNQIVADRRKDYQTRIQEAEQVKESYRRITVISDMSDIQQNARVSQSLTGIEGRDLKKRKKKIEQMRAQAAIIVEKQENLKTLYKELEKENGNGHKAITDAIIYKISMLKFEILEAQYQYNYKYIKAYGKKDADEAERLAQLALEFAVKKDTLLNNTDTTAIQGRHLTSKEKKLFASRRKAVDKELAKTTKNYQKAVDAHKIIKIDADDFEQNIPVENNAVQNAPVEFGEPSLELTTEYVDIVRAQELSDKGDVEKIRKMSIEHPEWNIQLDNTSVKDVWPKALFSDGDEEKNLEIMEAFYSGQFDKLTEPVETAIRKLDSFEPDVWKNMTVNEVSAHMNEIYYWSQYAYRMGKIKLMPFFSNVLEKNEINQIEFEQKLNKLNEVQKLVKKLCPNFNLVELGVTISTFGLLPMSEKDKVIIRAQKSFPNRQYRTIDRHFDIISYDKLKELRLQEDEKNQIVNAYPIFKERPELFETIVVGGLLQNVKRKEDGTFANEAAKKAYYENREAVATLLSKDKTKIKGLFAKMLRELRQFEVQDYKAYLGTGWNISFHEDDVSQAIIELMQYNEQNKNGEDALLSFSELTDELKSTNPKEFARISQLLKLHSMRRESSNEIIRLSGLDRKTHSFIPDDKEAEKKYIADHKDEFIRETAKIEQLQSENIEESRKKVFVMTQEYLDEFVAVHERMKDNSDKYNSQVPDEDNQKTYFERDIRGFMNLQDENVSAEDQACNERLLRAYLEKDSEYIAKVVNHFAEVILKLPFDYNYIKNAGINSDLKVQLLIQMFTKKNQDPEVVKRVDAAKYKAASAKVLYFTKLTHIMSARMSTFGIDITTGKQLAKLVPQELAKVNEDGGLNQIRPAEINMEVVADELIAEGHKDIADLLTTNHTEIPDLKLRIFD